MLLDDSFASIVAAIRNDPESWLNSSELPDSAKPMATLGFIEGCTGTAAVSSGTFHHQPASRTKATTLIITATAREKWVNPPDDPWVLMERHCNHGRYAGR